VAGEVAFSELGEDTERGRAFSERLFGWQFEPGPSGSGFTIASPSIPGGMHGSDAGAAPYLVCKVDDIEAALTGMLKPIYEEVQLGSAEIREVFRSSKVGNIAGCIVRSGEIRRNSKARLVRDGAVVGDNLTVDSLRRFTDDATEVREGFECGIGLGSFNDIKVGDVIETLETREKARS